MNKQYDFLNVGEAVLVIWADIHVYGGGEWVSSDEAIHWWTTERPTCKTLGFYLDETSDCLYITDSLMVEADEEYSSMGGIHAFPKNVIKNVIALRP